MNTPFTPEQTQAIQRLQTVLRAYHTKNPPPALSIMDNAVTSLRESRMSIQRAAFVEYVKNGIVRCAVDCENALRLADIAERQRPVSNSIVRSLRADAAVSCQTAFMHARQLARHHIAA